MAPKTLTAEEKSKQKANLYIAAMAILIIASIAIMIVHFVTMSSEDSVQPSLQLQISPQLNSSLRAGPLKTEEPPKMSKKWNEGKPLDENSNRLQNIFDMMSSINY